MTEERLEEIRRRCDWWCDQIQKADDEAIDRGEAHGNYGETWAEAVSYCGSLLTHVYNLRTENEELENKCTRISTMMKCVTCHRSVKPMYAIHGMCPECARKEVERLREELSTQFAMACDLAKMSNEADDEIRSLRDWQKRAAVFVREHLKSLGGLSWGKEEAKALLSELPKAPDGD